jgi:hypothetical protein
MISNPLQLQWARFVELAIRDQPAAARGIRAPASRDDLVQVESSLGVPLPPELEELYLLADGFEPGAFLLRDEYRILPVKEMAAASLKLVGEPVVRDELAGVAETPKKLVRLWLATTKDTDPDVSAIYLRLRKRTSSVEIDYREGGVHDLPEVVDSSLAPRRLAGGVPRVLWVTTRAQSSSRPLLQRAARAVDAHRTHSKGVARRGYRARR